MRGTAVSHASPLVLASLSSLACARSQEVEGLSNKLLQGPETDQALLDDLMASVRRGEPSSATLVNYKKGGERFVNQVKVVPVYNENEEVEQFMAMLTEVDTVPQF